MLEKILKSSNLKLLPINLQLFAEDNVEEVTGDVDDVVDYPDDAEDVEVDFPEVDEGEKEEDDADPLTDSDDVVVEDSDEVVVEDSDEVVVEDSDEDEGQTSEENSQFRKMRLKAEAEARKKVGAERAEVQRMKQEIEAEKLERKIRQEYMSQEKVWDMADKEGVSEDTARKLLEAEVDKVIRTEKERVRQQYESRQREKNNFRDDEYFTLVEHEVDAILDANPDITYETAYFHVVGKNRKELNNKVARNTEKRTLANVQDRMKRRGVSATSKSAPQKTTLSKTTMEINNVLGIDSREVAKHKAQNAHRFKL